MMHDTKHLLHFLHWQKAPVAVDIPQGKPHESSWVDINTKPCRLWRTGLQLWHKTFFGLVAEATWKCFPNMWKKSTGFQRRGHDLPENRLQKPMSWRWSWKAPGSKKKARAGVENAAAQLPDFTKELLPGTLCPSHQCLGANMAWQVSLKLQTFAHVRWSNGATRPFAGTEYVQQQDDFQSSTPE